MQEARSRIIQNHDKVNVGNTGQTEAQAQEI